MRARHPGTKVERNRDERKARARLRARSARELVWDGWDTGSQDGGASSTAGAAPVVLIDRGTSVTAPNSHDISEQAWPVIDREWCHRMIGRARKWHGRARRMGRMEKSAERVNATWRVDLGDPSAPNVVNPYVLARAKRYADARARTIALPRSKIVTGCGSRTITKKCACGPSVAEIGCGQILLCDRCRRPYYRRIRARTMKAINARLATATDTWKREGSQKGQRPKIVMMTMTVPRTLDGVQLSLDDRRHRLIDGWRKFRQWLHRRIGKFAFVGLPELKPGSDATGHLHYHVVCIWPFWDWTEAQAEWRRATGLPNANPPDFAVMKDSETAAHYVAKYASKGATSNAERTKTRTGSVAMTAELLADFVCTYYGKRRVTVSVGFWVPRPAPCCPRCQQAITVIERPVPISHGADAWRAMRRIREVDEWKPPPIEREPRQMTVDW